MGTETEYLEIIQTIGGFMFVKLNNPLMGTETLINQHFFYKNGRQSR